MRGAAIAAPAPDPERQRLLTEIAWLLGSIKRCLGCGKWKSIDQFYRDRSRRDGFTARCKPCDNTQVLQWQRANPEKARAYRRASRMRSPDRNYFSYILRTFGVTREQYEAQLDTQGGVCAICREPDRNGRRLAIDHDHTSGRLRGLLCRDCNVAVALFDENVFMLMQAIRYLVSPPWSE